MSDETTTPPVDEAVPPQKPEASASTTVDGFNVYVCKRYAAQEK
jgi:hypothetical protein